MNERFWRKHKKTGVVTQFVRGKAMRDYRALLVDSPSYDIQQEVSGASRFSVDKTID